MLPIHEKLTQLKKQCAAYAQQVDRANARAEAAELARDKAEQALRSMDRQFAATRDRLERAEAHLRSFGAAESTS